MSDPQNPQHTPPGGDHVDEMTLLLYVERQLDRASAQGVSLHTQTCARCLNLLRVLDRESRLLTRSMLEEEEPLPARLASFQARVKRSMQWIWGVVFGFAVLGVYALYTGYVEPWQQQLEQAGFGGSNILSLMVFQGAFWKGWQSMFSVLEAFALLAMASAGLFATRRYWRRGAAIALMFGGLGMLLAVAQPATATEFRKGDNLTIGKDETIKEDLFITGEHVRIEGTVDGDVYAFAQQVDVSGKINGDLICFAQSLRVSGAIDGNLRSVTNNTTVSGTIDRAVLTWDQVFNLDASGKIGRSLIAGGQSVTVDGKVERDFLGFFETGTITGFIGGSVKSQGKSLSINSGAEVAGKAEFEGDAEPSVSSQAKLASPFVFKKIEHHKESRRGGDYYLWRGIWTGAFLLFGLTLAGLMPRFSLETVEAAGNLGASFGLGILVIPGVFLAALIACVTIVGLLVGLSSLMLWLIALIASEIVVGGIVGQWILGRNDQFWPFFLRILVGVIVVRIVTSLPFIGGWAALAVSLWGVGAISLALYRRLQPTLAPNVPPVPMPPMNTPLPPQTTVGGI